MLYSPQPYTHDRKPRRFSLSSSFLDEFEHKEVAWGPVGYFTFKRTYARKKDDGSTEEWWEAVKRVVEGCFNYQKNWCRMQGTRWDEQKAQRSAQDMYGRIFTFKFTPPGRGLWMVGTKLVEEKGSAALQNCAFVSTQDIDSDFAAPFTFLMDMSMLGVGVGGDCKGAGKVRIQVPRLSSTPFVVEDSREGWVELIQTALNSFVGRGYFPTVIDYTKVRPKGSPILGFGGTASGPGPLKKLVEGISRLLLGEEDPMAAITWAYEGDENAEQDIVTASVEILSEEARRIQSTQIVDIFNFIGKCVVAGGVRRTAEIMFGEIDDPDFINLKSDETLRPLYTRKSEIEEELSKDMLPEEHKVRWEELKQIEARINAHPLIDRRWASNNSIIGHLGMDYTDIAKRIVENGEPGIFWLENARQFGRMGDAPNNKDYRVMGTNPCFAAETLIAVADGRGAVPIKTLAEEGHDVPVYSIRPDGAVEIQMGRNPRLTRERSSLVEIVLRGGSSFRVTPDHKMRLLDGTEVKAKDLQKGDSLPRFSKEAIRLSKTNPSLYLKVKTHTLKRKSTMEHRLIAQFCDPEGWEDLYDENKKVGWTKGGLVVHHKDFNSLNNSPDNLQVMLFKDHTALHCSLADFAGDKNPMWGRTHSAKTKAKIGEKTKERCADPVFLKKLAASHSAAERREASERLSQRRIEEFQVYYKEQEALTDLDTVWMAGRLHAVKSCESCNEEFVVAWRAREQSYCSRSCGNKSSAGVKARRVGQHQFFADRQRKTLHRQVMAYKDLQESLGRDPAKKEWEQEAKNQNIPVRFRSKGSTTNPHALRGFKHLKEVAFDYNHRVSSVRSVEGEEPVYNLTVDHNHTLAVVTSQSQDGSSTGIYTSNCGEQSLESFELCNLGETYPAHHDSLEDYLKTVKMAYLYCKTITLIPTHDVRANNVMNRNRRIGLSMSGIVQAVNKLGRHQFQNWCNEAYQAVQFRDKQYSDWLGIPLSIKTTSVKPSGTVSLLCGATPGIHFPHSEFYIRRIRVADTSPLVKAAQESGYVVEPDVYADDTSVVEFPVHEKFFTKAKADASIWEQFSLASSIQRHWADNQVSVTVTFNDKEASEVATCLEVFEGQLKSVSMLPLNDHSYTQAPYEEIDAAQYAKMTRNIKPLNLNPKTDTHDIDAEEKFCSNDSCEISFGPG